MFVVEIVLYLPLLPPPKNSSDLRESHDPTRMGQVGMVGMLMVGTCPCPPVVGTCPPVATLLHCADRMGQIFSGGLKKRMHFETVRNGSSRSSKVIDFGTNRKRVCNFLLVVSSNLGPILPRFRDIAGFLLSRATPPLFNPNFGEFPWTRMTMFWLRGAKSLS